ncbi:hypothetical protein LCGC14_1923350 [marine sediment metagenome]|uniref:Uncharacterized protein n=1 Tax=marine sediment metagenome TaxID=412755 RepID=A0A0F9FQU4_9ZZZZ
MKLLLLVLLLLTPTIAQSQDTSFTEILPVDEIQYRPAQVDAIISAVIAIEGAQRGHIIENGIYAWHPDSLVPLGLRISWRFVGKDSVRFRPTVLPWNVDIVQLARKNSELLLPSNTLLPPSWRVILVIKKVKCWYPESTFDRLPPNIVDISDSKLVGLVCATSRTNR